MQESDHFVQFYESDDYLVESVTGYVAAALESGNASIVIATLDHRIAIQRELANRGIAVAAAIEAGRYMVLDAADMLTKFMVSGMPDADLFNEHVGRIIADLADGERRVHAFGEMVSLLWSNGDRHAAIRLEELWNELGKIHRFALFCAYPISTFDDASQGVPFNGICACHSHVIPAESYSDIDNADDRLRAVTRLQQKAQSLEAEIAHRSEVQKTLAQRERELIEADRRKDLFLATLAHELRNPLAPIRNSLEVLRTEIDDKSLLNHARDVMERQVAQMTRLVEDLLDVSRITGDKLELRKEPISLSDVLTTAIETSRPLIDDAGHKLAVNLPTTSVWLDADPTRLAQIFSNLLNNSAKYTEHGGQIQVEASRAGRHVLVTVRDNGVGIASDALPHVFDMFRQTDWSLTRSQGGLGIGLTLVRRLVELHGGTIEAKSDGVGKGSEFTVRLPIAKQEKGQVTIPRPHKNVIAKRHRILVVDDNKDSGDSLSMLLRVKGHDVRTARDGLQAIDMTPDFQPNVILMDIGMPKLNGYDTTRHIRTLPSGRDVMIIALTGWGQPEDLRQSTEAGCSAHLVKPVDFAELERLLAAAYCSAT
jgi:signal transduction histidine kinase/ActR/RegA family two-component response regulator